MARRPQTLFDTSKYITLRMAVWIALAALVLCVLVGLRYSAFDAMLLVA